MHRQVGSFDAAEFGFDLFFGWIKDDRAALAKHQLLDFDEANIPGINLIDLPLVHEDHLENSFASHVGPMLETGVGPPGAASLPKNAGRRRRLVRRITWDAYGRKYSRIEQTVVPFKLNYVNRYTAQYTIKAAESGDATDPVYIHHRSAQTSIGMPLQLEIVSEHSEILGEDHIRVFREDGGTIGRSLQNDWILPDPDRFLSGKHATIDFQSGAFYLADVSTNGVYINDDSEPLGKGNPRRLFHGDKLRMGDFEFQVTLDEGQSLNMPPPEPMTVVPDHIEQLVDEDSLKSGIQMLDEEAITGDAEFQNALFGSKSMAQNQATKTPALVEQPNPFAKAPPKTEKKSVDAAALLDSFMRGLEIERTDIHPSTDPHDVMENAGRVLKEFVDGSTELLVRRSTLKSMFRLNQTTTLPLGNNPLKLAENTRDSMMQLLVGKEGEYLSPVDAVKEVYRDLKFHHDAVLDAMLSAYQDFADRFNPDELQPNFDRTLDSKPLLKKLNQIKYWQLYCDLYPVLTQSGSGKFPHQFSEEFVRSYESKITEYKKLERKGVQTKARNDEAAHSSYDEKELQDQTEDATYADQV